MFKKVRPIKTPRQSLDRQECFNTHFPSRGLGGVGDAIARVATRLHFFFAGVVALLVRLATTGNEYETGKYQQHKRN